MKRFFYFRDVANEDADDDISASVAIPVDSICGIVPVAITTLELYYKKEGLVNNQKATLTVTRGKLQEAMADIVSAANRHPHHSGLTVVADAATTTHGTSSIQGNDNTVSAKYISRHVTGVAIAQSGY